MGRWTGMLSINGDGPTLSLPNGSSLEVGKSLVGDGSLVSGKPVVMTFSISSWSEVHNRDCFEMLCLGVGRLSMRLRALACT